MEKSIKADVLSKKDLEINTVIERLDKAVAQRNAGKIFSEPLKIKSPYDEEILREYQAKYNPNEYEKVDERGNPIKVKAYIRPNEAAMDWEYLPVEEEEEKISEEQIKTYIKDVDDEITDLNRAYQYYLKALRDCENEHKELIVESEYYSDVSHFRNQEQFDDYKTDLKRRNERLLGEIDELKIALRETQDRISAAINRREVILKDAKNSNRNVEAVRQRNLARANAYRDELISLNSGFFTAEKEPDETEEEYMDRLYKTAHEETPIDQFTSAKRELNFDFKKRLKELVREESKIEQINNSLSYDQKFLLMKKWEGLRGVKKEFIREFGLKNKYATADEILSFFGKYIEESKRINEGLMMSKEDKRIPEESQRMKEMRLMSKEDKPLTREEEIEELEREDEEMFAEEAPHTRIVPIFQQDSANSRLRMNNRETYKTIMYFKYCISSANKGVTLYSLTGASGSYKQIIESKSEFAPYNFKKDVESVGVEFEDFQNLMNHALAVMGKRYDGRSNTSDALLLIMENLNIPRSPKAIMQTNRYNDGRRDKTYLTGGSILGYGLEAEKIPVRAQFGKICVLPKKLFYENILAVKHHTGQSIAGFPNVKVSDNFVKIVLDMLKGHQVPFGMVDKLPSAERQVIDHLFRIAGLTKQHGSGSSEKKTISDLKKRLELLQGEVAIGNNSIAIYKEIQRILIRLKDFGQISNKDMKEYLKQFEKY